jgi:hypothetical protein
MNRFQKILAALALTCSVCLHGHYERRLIVASWTQFIWVGKVMIPIIHPAIYSNVFVCDECSDAKTPQ